MLADAIVIVHLCIVVFVLTGVPLIYLRSAALGMGQKLALAATASHCHCRDCR
jgi:hypothetical protein